jgi:hypothetical protein
MNSAPGPNRDLDAPLMVALCAREKPPDVPVVADDVWNEPPRQGLGVDAAGPMFTGDLARYLRHRSSLAPEFLEPKPLEGGRTGVPNLLRLSGVTAIAAVVAWALVSLPGVGQRSGHNNVHTAAVSNPASGTARPAAAAIAPVSSSSSVSQSETFTSRPDDEETSTLIKLGQDLLKNGDFSSARLLLGRAANAGSAAAALLLGDVRSISGPAVRRYRCSARCRGGA